MSASIPTPADLLALARAALEPCSCDRGKDCASCHAARELAALLEERGPATIAALCERLGRACDALGLHRESEHPMTTPLLRPAEQENEA